MKDNAKLTRQERIDVMSLMAEGFHAAFRKATSHELAHPIWSDIRALPGKEWASVIDFVMMGVQPEIERIIRERLPK